MQATNPVNQPGLWEAELVRKGTAFTSNRPKAASVSKVPHYVHRLIKFFDTSNMLLQAVKQRAK